MTITPQLVKEYSASSELRRRLYRRTLGVVVVSQVLGGAGLAAGITVGALLAQGMLGSTGLSGVPTALFTVGSAGAAFAVGRISQRFGRRVGLAGGFLAGALGAALVVASAVANNVTMLFIALVIYGAGSATNLQARYAGTDLAVPTRRATAVSVALVATTLGAVAGPNLVTLTGEFAVSIGVPTLAGPFLLAAVAYAAAALVLLLWLRPDPFLLAAAISADEGAASQADVSSSASRARPKRAIMVGAAVMIVTQVAMVAIMTMTPVEMGMHGQSLAAVGGAIGVHIGFMYLPSLVTGVLVDKVGRRPMAAVAGFTLLLAGVMAATAPADGMVQLTIALALLGLGWNFGLISGTAIVIDAAPAATRARTQGNLDVLISLAGATGGALSGVVVANGSFALLSFGGGILSLLLVPVLMASREARSASSKVA